MGDSDAALKRRVAAMEAAPGSLRADFGARSDARGTAVTELVAAVREQTAAIRTAAATANAEAKPGVPPGFAATPMRMAPACHAAAPVLQAGPAVAPGTDLRGSWPAVWAQRAVRQHAAWRATATDLFARPLRHVCRPAPPRARRARPAGAGQPGRRERQHLEALVKRHPRAATYDIGLTDRAAMRIPADDALPPVPVFNHRMSLAEKTVAQREVTRPERLGIASAKPYA
eukprot:g1697.t1